LACFSCRIARSRPGWCAGGTVTAPAGDSPVSAAMTAANTRAHPQTARRSSCLGIVAISPIARIPENTLLALAGIPGFRRITAGRAYAV
jgi:hypothetical protein